MKLAKECVDANLTGFPAWTINGKRLDGEQSFDKLEEELQKAIASAPDTRTQSAPALTSSG